MIKKNIRLSVIIPTYKSWELLKKNIRALESQSLNQSLFEVIVVDNDGNEKITLNTQLQNFKIIVERNPGSYAARNSGLKIASGEIIAFTDADCIPHKNWLEQLNEVFANNAQIDRVGGKIEFYQGKASDACLEFESLFSFKQEEKIQQGIAVTANLAVRREVIDVTGGFNSKLFSGGDIEWNKRATSQGFNIYYLEDAIVKHPARSLAEILKKAQRTYPQKMNKIQGRLKKSILGIKYLLPPITKLKRISNQNIKIEKPVAIFLILYLRRLAMFTEHYRLLLGFQNKRS